MIGVKADRPVIVGDGFLITVQLGVAPGPLEMEPRTAPINADRLHAMGDGFLDTADECHQERGWPDLLG